MTKSAIRLACGLAVAALAAAGCAGSSAHDQGNVTVVATTDVWGSVANAVAGTHATVTSIVSGANADPHSFEATPADVAKITDASLVVYNGGGYDHWVDGVLAGKAKAQAVDAYSLRSPGEANEHVFYDLGTVKAVATEIAKRLTETDPAHGDEYHSSAIAFGNKADDILRIEQAIGKTHPGASVVATEPVAFYLLRNAGIADRTPPGFANAVEEGDDPSPADVAAMLDLINTHQVSVLLFNPQTQTSATKQLEDAARKASLPVLTVTETLPAGRDYLTWQRDTAGDLASRFDKAPQTNR